MKKFSIKKIKRQNVIIAFLTVTLAALSVNYYKLKSSKDVFLPIESKVIVIDPGHGGWDPGKTGVNGANEKDINLAIAKKLAQYLEDSGADVIMTRDDDEALSENKREDLKLRTESIDESDLLISIHQNSFPQQKIWGAQVFYYESSDEGKKLAELVQLSIKEYIGDGNKRVPKSSDSYYILKNTDVTSIIVECGFLSNNDEEQKLNSEQYQDKIAWAIYMGILKYFNEV